MEPIFKSSKTSYAIYRVSAYGWVMTDYGFKTEADARHAAKMDGSPGLEVVRETICNEWVPLKIACAA